MPGDVVRLCLGDIVPADARLLDGEPLEVDQSALAAVRDSALDAAYYRKQHARHEGHPKPHGTAMLALAWQRFKVVYKLMTTDAVYDKEILIASHLQREQARAEYPNRAA